MKTNNEHTRTEPIDRQSKTFFANGSFRWKKDESLVWSHIETVMAKVPAGRGFVFNFRKQLLAAAAVLLLLLSTGAFLRFYALTISTLAGEHQLAEFPDGSTVYLNAESNLSYNPYWWAFSRNINFEGEALFSVVKGKKFEVKSANGRTVVLGTSFNVFARGSEYSVTCLSGSVKVTSTSKNSIVLVPESKATILHNGQINVQYQIESLPEISWKDNLFRFTASPIVEVFREIERQYGISIMANVNLNSRYTGSFNRTSSIDEVFQIVCPPMGLSFEKQADGKYLITQKNE